MKTHCRRNLSIAPAEFIVCLSYSFSINRQLSYSLFTGTSILMALQPYLPGEVNLMFSFIQCFSISGISEVRSRNVNPEKPAVCVERIADGIMPVSTPQADIIGNATVSEHCPTHEMS